MTSIRIGYHYQVVILYAYNNENFVDIALSVDLVVLSVVHIYYYLPHAYLHRTFK